MLLLQNWQRHESPPTDGDQVSTIHITILKPLPGTLQTYKLITSSKSFSICPALDHNVRICIHEGCDIWPQTEKHTGIMTAATLCDMTRDKVREGNLLSTR